MREVRQRGLFYEELETGVIYRHSPGGEHDNTLFSTLTMNPAAIHLDAVLAEGTEFGQRLVNSMFTLSTLVGPRASRSPISASAKSPVGLAAQCRDRTVTFEHTARNQRDEVVALTRRNALMLRRAESCPVPEWCRHRTPMRRSARSKAAPCENACLYTICHGIQVA